MAKPELTIQRLYELVDVDLLRGLVFPRTRRCARYPRVPWQRVGTGGYVWGTIAGSSFSAHRVIWAFAHGAWPPQGMDVDHCNGLRSDNRLSNLRLATRRQNCSNRRCRGISFHRRDKLFRARVSVGGKEFSRYFKTESEAAAAYRLMHAELHGEFSPYWKEAEA